MMAMQVLCAQATEEREVKTESRALREVSECTRVVVSTVERVIALGEMLRKQRA
jgi:hypothetical protein